MKHYIAKWKTYEFVSFDRVQRHRCQAIYASSLRQVRDMIEQMDPDAHMIKVSIYKESE